MTNKTKVIVAIVSAGVVASITASVKFFPDLMGILTAANALIIAVVSYIEAK